jgi:hypothetical protein
MCPLVGVHNAAAAQLVADLRPAPPAHSPYPLPRAPAQRLFGPGPQALRSHPRGSQSHIGRPSEALASTTKARTYSPTKNSAACGDIGLTWGVLSRSTAASPGSTALVRRRRRRWSWREPGHSSSRSLPLPAHHTDAHRRLSRRCRRGGSRKAPHHPPAALITRWAVPSTSARSLLQPQYLCRYAAHHAFFLPF